MNPALLEQAVINLLDNAIKYSEPGSEVQVLASQFFDEVTITVSDRGCGITAEHLPRIFERFYRVDKGRSRKLGGTGLGLAIVKHIVQAHHGRVTVKSTPAVGSVFTIHLPRPTEHPNGQAGRGGQPLRWPASSAGPARLADRIPLRLPADYNRTHPFSPPPIPRAEPHHEHSS